MEQLCRYLTRPALSGIAAVLRESRSSLRPSGTMGRSGIDSTAQRDRQT
jgi:hypothetical protein